MGCLVSNPAPAQTMLASKQKLLAWCLELGTRERSLPPACRGSFLYFSGSRAFQQVLLRQHDVLQRHALLLKAALDPLDDADRDRLEVCECLQGAQRRAGSVCTVFALCPPPVPLLSCTSLLPCAALCCPVLLPCSQLQSQAKKMNCKNI